MTIIATCGHERPDFDEKYSITGKGHTPAGKRYLIHLVACLNCQKRYRRAGVILDTEEEEQAWVQATNQGSAQAWDVGIQGLAVNAYGRTQMGYRE